MSLAIRIQQTLTLLQRAARDFQPLVMASSLGAEDMVLTDLIFKHDLPVDIFTLDTGRLPESTQRLMARVLEVYGKPIRVVFPQSHAVEALVAKNGVNGFYHSIEARVACCAVRKVEPLKRALAGQKAWLTGLRRDQSPTRTALASEAWDADNGLTKFNPMAEWTRADVWSYIKLQQVPYNPMHDQGFASIGCSPCTRALQPGENERAGRWWWEHPQTKECGLHLSVQPERSIA